MEADLSQVQGEMDESVQAARNAEEKARKAITDVSLCKWDLYFFHLGKKRQQSYNHLCIF